MKVLLLGFGKIAYMPYMNFYLDTLKGQDDIHFELVYWDRDGKPDAEVPSVIEKSYKFEAHLEEQLPFKKKLKYFFKYRSFAIRILKQNRYDKIIVLHTTPGLTLLDYLLLHYRKNFVLDFRDVSYEYIFFYRKLVGLLARGSILTCVSSDAFRKFLPHLDNIYTVHNYLEDSLSHLFIRQTEPRKRDILRVSYWGLVRQVGVNEKLMDALGNDPRFELHYYGRMQQNGRDMVHYAKSKGYANVYFHGAYMPQERYDFARKTDLIHNVYDCGHTMGNAMGNKYYDGIIFGIPQICTRGSYMGQLVSDKQVGVSISLEDKQLADTIWNYYQDLDWGQFDLNCALTFRAVQEEQKRAKGQLRNIFRLK